MSVVTVRPSSTVSSSEVTVGGGGTVHGALADDSDVTYLTGSDDEVWSARVALANPTVPAGAALRRVDVRVRCRLGSFWESSQDLGVALFDGSAPSWAGPIARWVTQVTWSTPLTVTAGSTVLVDTAQLDDLQLEVIDDYGDRVYAAYVDCVFVAAPVVTVAAPSGAITANQPVVAWTVVLDSGGGQQTGWQVKVFTAAQVAAGGFDADVTVPVVGSGVQSGQALSWPLSAALLPGDYEVFVRAAQTVSGTSLWSAWDSSVFTVDGDAPPSPTLTLTAEPEYGRIVVAVDGEASATTTDAIEVQTSPDGVTWAPVRCQSETGIITGDSVAVYDYEAPIGTVVWYRARALHDYGGGVLVASTGWSEDTTSWETSDWWLKDPVRPDLNMRLAHEMFSYADVNRAVRQGVFHPLGATVPVVVSDTRASASGTIILQLADAARQAVLGALLDGRRPLLLQGPPADGHPDRYVMLGDHGSQRVIDKGWSHLTRDTLPWTRVARPAGAQVTLGRILTTWESSWVTAPAHVTTTWESSYVVEGHVVTTWESSYVVEDHVVTTWESSYLVGWTHVTTTWESSYVVEGHVVTTWESSYVVEDHVITTWESSYTVTAGVTTVGPNSPSTGADVAGIGTETWSTPGNVTSSNDARATVELAEMTSHYLRATGFGFAIPGGATILGITLEVELSASAGSSIYDAAVRLVKAGTIVGDDKKRAASTRWPTSDGYVAYGGSSDLWGTTWTASDINNANFGAVIAAEFDGESSVTARVDHMRITVRYSG